MRRRSLLAAALATPWATIAAPRLARASPQEVDLLLVLAADVSQSMQYQDLLMQRRGYAAALRDPDVWKAIASGPRGEVGVLYLEWSGATEQEVLVPWMRIGDPGSAERFASSLEEAPIRSGTQTSISGAIAAARRQFAGAPFIGDRMVVDISGDGENNHGGPVGAQRDAAVAEGITINGLPVVRQGARLAAAGEGRETALEEHYRSQVICGAGAFVLPAQGFETFPAAIRRKLVLEIAGLPAPATLA